MNRHRITRRITRKDELTPGYPRKDELTPGYPASLMGEEVAAVTEPLASAGGSPAGAWGLTPPACWPVLDIEGDQGFSV